MCHIDTKDVDVESEAQATIPTHFDHPPMSAYPFINLMWEDYRTFDIKWVVPYYRGDADWDWDDEHFTAYAFKSAASVKSDILKVLSDLSDDTFKNLIGRFGSSVSDVRITSRADLVVAAELAPGIYPGATPEQLQAYLLYHARCEHEIHWGQVVDLYNSSPRDQQIAICNFFDEFLNRPLHGLLTCRGPEPLPAELEPVMQTRQNGISTEVFCPPWNTWVRDDKITSLLMVEGRLATGGEFHVISYASCIEEACARATQFAANIDPYHPVVQLNISLEEKVVASTMIVSAKSGRSAPGSKRLPIRLDWNLKNTGPEFTSDQVRNALIKAETFYGFRWSKVKKLEDELGL